MEVLGSLVSDLIKSSASILDTHIGLCCYKKKVDSLSKTIAHLSQLKADIEVQVNEATRNGDRITDVVTQWIRDVNQILIDHSMVDFESIEIDGCFKGWCCGRYSLGKKANKMIDDVTELLKAQKRWGRIANPVATQDIEMLSTKDFEVFESTEIAKEKVIKALNNVDCSIIGVHGMGGIGKTTLMKKIGSLIKAKYNVVVLVAVSQNQDVKKIQDEIAGELQLTFGQEGADSRAKRLVSRLKTEEKVLIILDDIWKRLELAEVGIPWGAEHKGCKVVLTTRRKAVCTTMETHADVELECLSEQDAWKLFRTNAYVNDSDDIGLIQLAKTVAKECKGLPVALVTLGRAMHKKKDLDMWKNVLRQLKESDIRHIEGMEEAVFKAIKLSYDYLPEDYKQFLLFCCLFPEDHKISMVELLKYMIGEGKIKDLTISRSEQTLDNVVNYLTSSHLLQKGDKGGFVTMHDVIRDVAINIATSDHGFIVMAGKELDAWPEKEMLKECKRLSLMGNELSQLPESPDCPNLLTLALSGCDSLNYIPESFFERMVSLVNLDISYTPISTLPSSLALLKNLKTICLDGCSELRDASLIGKLITLKVISLNKTSIDILPLGEIAEFPDKMLVSRGK